MSNRGDPKAVAVWGGMWEIPVMKTLRADSSKRIVLPSPVKPHSVWVPVMVTEKEIRLIAYEEPKEPPRAKGRIIINSDGRKVWEGEMVMEPVDAVNLCREEDWGG